MRRLGWCAIGCALLVMICPGLSRAAATSVPSDPVADVALLRALRTAPFTADKAGLFQACEIDELLKCWTPLLQQAAADPNAATQLSRTADGLWRACRLHAASVDLMRPGWEDHLYALGYLGPVAFRMYLSAVAEPGFSLATISRYRNSSVVAMQACVTVLMRRHDARVSVAATQLALHIMITMGAMVTGEDLPAFRTMFGSRDNYRVGTVSLRATKSIGETILDGAVDPNTRKVAVKALAAAFSAHEVFFCALKTVIRETYALYDTYKAAESLAPKTAKAFRDYTGVSPDDPVRRLQEYITSVPAEEFISPSRIVAYCTDLLTSEQTCVQGAEALGHMVPSALRFVDGVMSILDRVPADVRPAVGRNTLLIATSAFDAVFALADAAVSENHGLRKVASEALSGILDPYGPHYRKLDPNDPNTPLRSVVDRTVALLGPGQQKDQGYSVENEAFNALLVIPLATRETLARMTARAEGPGGRKIKAQARQIGALLTTLAETTTGRIAEKLDPNTELYTARRYFLVLRLYGEAVPNRLEQYLHVLRKLAGGEAALGEPTTSIDLKRLAAKEALDAFQAARGSLQRDLIREDQFEAMRQSVDQIADAYAGTKQEDPILRDYLRALSKRIADLRNESYGLVARVRGWWKGLPVYTQGVLVTLGSYLLLLSPFVAIWLVAPGQMTKWAMIDATREEGLSCIEKATRFLSLIKYLGCTPRALDAWLVKFRGQLLPQTFRIRQGNVGLRDEESDTIKRLRAYYTDLGNQADVRRFCDLVRQRKPVALWVQGTGGGSGKTTLACHLAYEAMNKSRHPVLPVVMTRGWGESLVSGVTDLCMIGSRALTPRMVRNLAKRGRILLIVDGLSEIGGHLNGDRKWFSSLIVTARHRPPEEEAPFRTVTVGSLNRKDTKKLDEFVRRYVRDRQVQTRAERLIEKLMEKNGGGPAEEQRILPLFAYLAIDYVKRNPEQAQKAEPDSSLGLVLDYCRALRPRGPKALTDYSFWDAACAAAYAVMEERLAPRYVDRHVLRTALAMTARTTPFRDVSEKDVSPEEALQQLEQSGVLAGPPGDSRQLGILYIGFRYDVVAEYLAALYIKGQPEMMARVQQMGEQARDFARILAEVQQATPYAPARETDP